MPLTEQEIETYRRDGLVIPASYRLPGATLERINQLISHIPQQNRGSLRPIQLMVLRPSVDLGRLAADFEPRLPGAFRFFTRGLGTHKLRSPDFLSLLMFQSDYLTSLIEIGEKDAEASLGELEAWMEP